ncbi:MAG: hypothetical protein IPM82_30850 [Saprospiraceae bacterium]|nr:hypothetical protein [Saprospiraceae bacterium]
MRLRNEAVSEIYFTLIGFVQIGVWGGTPQKTLSPDEPPKAARRGSGA